MTDKEIHRICKEYGIENYTIENGLVNVNSGVDLNNKRLIELPLKFGVVSGDFRCASNYLTSLEGSPLEVGGSFYCYFNKLRSLDGAPVKVGGSFYCYSNKLTSLKGAPLEVGSGFYTQGNKKELSYEKYLLKMNRLNKINLLND